MVTVTQSTTDETNLCVELDEDEQTILEKAAAERDMTFEDYVLDVIHKQLRVEIEKATPEPETA